MLLVFAGIAALIPIVNAVRSWFGFGQRRTLEQPISIKASPEYALVGHTHHTMISRDEYERIAANCAAERRQQALDMAAIQEATQRQIDFLGSSIRAELKQHNDAAEERSNSIHSRISALLGPVEATKARLSDHIGDSRAHMHGNGGNG